MMKNLRRLIRQIILEGSVKDEFDEAWYNTEIERETYRRADSEMGTFPRDAIDHGYQYRLDYSGDEIDQLFVDKRDLKRLWNETIDSNGLRSFWEGPKMKYFHSLSYYGNAMNAVDTMQQGEYSDNDIRDLSLAAFLEKYNKTGNKDEMSTWGYHVPSNYIACPPNQMILGVILKGRLSSLDPDMLAPILDKGSIILLIGLLERDSSPVRLEEKLCIDSNPDINLIPVPELPK